MTEVIVDPEGVKAEPEPWACIGQEETKLIDYTPGKFSARRSCGENMCAKTRAPCRPPRHRS